jgi:DnaB-like helicase N terminal domain/AAA domain
MSSQHANEGAVPPQDLDAEESVLGAVLISGARGQSASIVAAIRATGLEPGEFYKPSHDAILQTIYGMDAAGEMVDAVTLAAALEASGKLERVGGKVRVHELAALSPASANAEHWARIVRDRAAQREEQKIGQALVEAAWNGGIAAHPELAASLRRVLDGRPSARWLEGMSHAEALAAEIPEVCELVEGIIDLGTVGAIVGLPYARKSWACQELARKVAADSGLFLGKFPILSGGPVVYCWQDDSTAKMLERVQARADEPQLPIRWLLNEGVRLPDDLRALRELVERDEAVLVVFDSLYNFLPVDVKLKDEDVAPVLAALKSDLCDRTGATVAVADHAPWPSESNRGQRRAYGSVFKTAAVRWHLHLETDGKDDTRLHVEARGNNVAGFPRSPACWDEDAHEIRLLEPERLNDDELDSHILEFLTVNPGSSQSAIRAGVKGRNESIDSSLERLKGRGEVLDLARSGGAWSGQAGTPRYWYPANHAVLTPPQLFEARSDEVGAAAIQEPNLARSPHPRRGGEVGRGEVENGRTQGRTQDATDTFRAREGSS